MTRIPEFAETSIIDQFVHVLANSIVVVPFMTWDVANDGILLEGPDGLPALPSNDECVCLRRSASADQLGVVKESGESTLTQKKGHRRSASDTTGMKQIKNEVDSHPLGMINENVCFVNSR